MVELPSGTEMCMPGDNTDMTVELINPIAMDEGLRFAIREGGHRWRRSSYQDPQLNNGLFSKDPHSLKGLRPRHRGPKHPKIVETVLRTQANIKGPVPLPTEEHRYTVVRSPHKDKDSREHFEMRIHKRLIDIVEPSPKTVDSLQRLELPAGVDIEIKIQQG